MIFLKIKPRGSINNEQIKTTAQLFQSIVVSPKIKRRTGSEVNNATIKKQNIKASQIKRFPVISAGKNLGRPCDIFNTCSNCEKTRVQKITELQEDEKSFDNLF